MRVTRRESGRARKGQFVVIYIMGVFAMFILAFATIGVGQVVVRKQWAQLIADAGAYAGAAKEAEGLNTIARITDLQYHVFRYMHYYNRQIGYEVDGVWELIEALFGSGPRDDIWDAHDDYVKQFFTLTNAAVISIENDPTGTIPGSRSDAYDQAKTVTEENFKRFFPNEPNTNDDYFKMPSQISYAVPLADLTPYWDETTGWWYHNLDGSSDLCYWGVCLGRDILSPLSYMFLDFTGFTWGDGDHDEQCENDACYHFEATSPPQSHLVPFAFDYGIMRLMDKDAETTFLWWVQIPATKPILGFQFPLGAIPPITAISRAKPYGGNIGFNSEEDLNSENDVWPQRHAFWYWDFDDLPPTAIPPALNWNVQWSMNKEAVTEYKVKFVPVMPLRIIPGSFSNSRMGIPEDIGVLIELAMAHSGSLDYGPNAGGSGNTRGGREESELLLELVSSINH